MFATRPALTGSTISHFDSIARPNLLMEPYGQAVAKHDVDLTLAVLHDLGWRSECGNSRVEFGETCDRGKANSDSVPGACRTNCESAHCGDGVLDPGEGCDAGGDNSDDLPDACRSDCMRPRCGDGVVDANEPCDGIDCAADCVAPSAPAPELDAGPTVPWNDATSAHPDRPSRRSDGGCAIAPVPSSVAVRGAPRATKAAGLHAGWLLLLSLALRERRKRLRTG